MLRAVCVLARNIQPKMNVFSRKSALLHATRSTSDCGATLQPASYNSGDFAN